MDSVGYWICNVIGIVVNVVGYVVCLLLMWFLGLRGNKSSFYGLFR